MPRKVENIEVGSVYVNNSGEEYVVEKIISGRLEGGGIRIRFLFGNLVKYYDARTLRSGRFRSPYARSVFGIGHLGEGVHQPGVDGEASYEYARWKAMLNRCYNKTHHSKSASYKICAVNDNWLCFQNFAEWAKNQSYFKAGYDLDKDLLLRGNTVYSKETVCMLPSEINGALTRKDSDVDNGLPVGVSWHKKNKCFVVKMCENYLGSFSNIEDAWFVYKSAKKARVICLAEKWKDRIDDYVYKALLVWEPDMYFNKRLF